MCMTDTRAVNMCMYYIGARATAANGVYSDLALSDVLRVHVFRIRVFILSVSGCVCVCEYEYMCVCVCMC